MSLFEGKVDRSMRSIFVGNIPYEATEENLKDLFSEYGPLLNVRFFKDGSSQYAFCEYGEQEMALRAIRNLSNYALKGRNFTVDIAASDKSKEELASLQGFATGESSAEVLLGTDVTTEKAPEEISKAVASLPAEQMFELMKQMKMCIENNPQEARNLLLQNPQLAYALLQAQVIMRIVDPEVALKILNRPSPASTNTEQDPKPSVDVQQALPAVANPPSFSSAASALPATSLVAKLGPVSQPRPISGTMPQLVADRASDQDIQQFPSIDHDMRSAPPVSGDKDMRQLLGDSDLRTMIAPGSLADNRPFDPRFRPVDPRMMQGTDPRMVQGADPRMMQGADPRMMQGADPRMMQGADPRMIQGADPRMMQGADPRMVQGLDPRMMQGSDPRGMSGQDSRGMPGQDPRGMPGQDPRGMPSQDPRGMPGQDPRGMPGQDLRGMPGQDPRGMPGQDPRGMSGQDPRGMSGQDPRGMPGQDPRGIPGQDPRGIPGQDPRGIPGQDPRGMPGQNPRGMPSQDPRGMPSQDPRGMPSQDPRGMPSQDPRGMPSQDPRGMPGQDPRGMPGQDPRGMSGQDPRGMHGQDPRGMPGADMGNRGPTGPAFGPRSATNIDPRIGYDGRNIDPRKPPTSTGVGMPSNIRTPAPLGIPPNPMAVPRSSAPMSTGSSSIPEDEEKAALIMQVLQLSEEQIAALPPEQRQSIIVLKEQIARSQLTL